MIGALTAWLSRKWAGMAVTAIGLLSGAAYVLYVVRDAIKDARKRGRDDMRNQARDEAVEREDQRDAIERDVSSRGGSVDRLRSDWQRPDD